MKTSIFLVRIAFAGALAFAGVTAAADMSSGKGNDPAAYEPIIPDGVGGNDYDYDPAFAAGGVSLDRFAGAPGYYQGLRMTRLTNGANVSAGLVVIDGAYQLGIVRYSSSGRRETRSAVDAPYSRYNGQYIVFPNSPASDPKISYVSEIKSYGGKLFVLATQMYRASNGLDKYQPVIIAFTEDGHNLGWWFIRIDDDVHNEAIAMDITSNGRMTMLAANSGGGLYTRYWTARYKIGSDGVPVLDTGFGNGGASMFELASTVSSCPAALGGHCPISGVDLKHEGSLVLLVDPSFYVAFTKKYDDNGDHDPCIASFNGSGQLRTSFNGTGVRCYPFDDTGSNHDDEAVALRGDFHTEFSGGMLRNVQDIYLLATVARQFSPGHGLMRVDSASNPVAQFGGTGKIVWGGCGSGCTFNIGAETPIAFARQGNLLGIVGHWKPQLVDQPLLSIVDAYAGTVLNFETHALASGDANYNDVIGDPLGFTATGWARDGAADSSNRMFVTSHLIPARVADDTIFRYGLE